MASKRTKRAVIKLPIIPGKNETLLEAAERRANRAVDRWDFEKRTLKPSTLTNGLIGSGNSSYRNAFLEHKTAERLGDPAFYQSDKDGESEEYEIRPRGGMSVGPVVGVLWKTEWNRRTHIDPAEDLCWVPLPDHEIDRIKSEAIPAEDWRRWAAAFVLFASQLKTLRARRKIAADPDETEETAKTRKKRHVLPQAAIQKRLVKAAKVMKGSGNRFLLRSCGQIASGLGIGESTARAFLLQAERLGWIEKHGESKGTRYRLTEAGKEIVKAG